MSTVYKIMQEESGQWRLISRKQHAKALIEWTHKILTLLLIYIMEVTGKKTPTVTIDGKVAQEHVSIIQQGKVATRPDSPRMLKAATDVGGVVHQEQGEEVASVSSIMEDQGESHAASRSREDTAEWDTSEWDIEEQE